MEHDLDLRLPHPRGRLDGRAGARLHAGQRHRLRPGGGRRRARGRLVRTPALVLLQRPQRCLPGDREVPGGAHAVGADHARPVRRDRCAQPDAAVPCADRRLHADRAAAREQHRPGRAAGLLGGVRRRPEPAHERVRRGARPAHRAERDDRASHAADPGDGGRVHRHRRSVRRLVLRRGADRRAGGAGDHPDRADRRAGRRRRRGRAGMGAGSDRVGRLCLPRAGAGGGRGAGRRQPMDGGRRGPDRAARARPGVRAPPVRRDRRPACPPRRLRGRGGAGSGGRDGGRRRQPAAADARCSRGIRDRRRGVRRIRERVGARTMRSARARNLEA